MGRGELRPTYPLETTRLRLRPFRDTDLEALHAILSREDVHRYLYTTPFTRHQTRGSLQRRKQMRVIDASNADLVLAGETKIEQTLIGYFSLQLVSREHLQGEIGFVLHPDHQGHGYATEGAALMLDLGFTGLGLHRSVARCDARNVASVRVMERLGMRREAHLRENEYVKGEWTDELVYALLDFEWRRTVGRDQ